MISQRGGTDYGFGLRACDRVAGAKLQEIVGEGEVSGAGYELSRFLKASTPGRSLWYTHLALERMIFDELERALDPKARKGFRMIKQRARRNYGQRFWAPPGDSVERLPDLGAAVGR